MKKYKIELSEKQLTILMSALEGFTRAGTEQYDIMIQALTFYNGSYSDSKKILKSIREILKSDLSSMNESYGIHSRKINDDYRKAYDIIQVLRNARAWANAPDDEEDRSKKFIKYMKVDYDKPLKTSTEAELINCEEIKDK
jgi:hypothetical protein